MFNPTEIIVYRGPAEYALYNSPYTFPLMVAFAFFVLVFVILTRFRIFTHSDLGSYVAIGLSLLAAGMVLMVML